MVPVGGSGGCAVPCYKSMLGLPATYKVEHSPTSCACSDATDPEIVARYMSALYAKLAGSGSHPEAIVRLVVWMMHFQGDNFDADLRDRAERGGGDGDGAATSDGGGTPGKATEDAEVIGVSAVAELAISGPGCEQFWELLNREGREERYD